MSDGEEIRHYMQLWLMVLPDTSKVSLEEWDNFVRNENFQDTEKQPQNIGELPSRKKVLFPHWIMDRLKEAMDQYVKGQWLSSIALCNAIVEFLAGSMIEAYKDKIKERPERLYLRLLLLKCYGVLNEKDYKKLDEVRHIRNDVIHLDLKTLNKKLTKQELRGYQESLKSRNLQALKNLLDFFNKDNIAKYPLYLKYLSQV